MNNKKMLAIALMVMGSANAIDGNKHAARKKAWAEYTNNKKAKAEERNNENQNHDSDLRRQKEEEARYTKAQLDEAIEKARINAIKTNFYEMAGVKEAANAKVEKATEDANAKVSKATEAANAKVEKAQNILDKVRERSGRSLDKLVKQLEGDNFSDPKGDDDSARLTSLKESVGELVASLRAAMDAKKKGLQISKAMGRDDIDLVSDYNDDAEAEDDKRFGASYLKDANEKAESSIYQELSGMNKELQSLSGENKGFNEPSVYAEYVKAKAIAQTAIENKDNLLPILAKEKVGGSVLSEINENLSALKEKAKLSKGFGEEEGEEEDEQE